MQVRLNQINYLACYRDGSQAEREAVKHGKQELAAFAVTLKDTLEEGGGALHALLSSLPVRIQHAINCGTLSAAAVKGYIDEILLMHPQVNRQAVRDYLRACVYLAKHRHHYGGDPATKFNWPWQGLANQTGSLAMVAGARPGAGTGLARTRDALAQFDGMDDTAEVHALFHALAPNGWRDDIYAELTHPAGLWRELWVRQPPPGAQPGFKLNLQIAAGNSQAARKAEGVLRFACAGSASRFLLADAQPLLAELCQRRRAEKLLFSQELLRSGDGELGPDACLALLAAAGKPFAVVIDSGTEAGRAIAQARVTVLGEEVRLSDFIQLLDLQAASGLEGQTHGCLSLAQGVLVDRVYHGQALRGWRQTLSDLLIQCAWPAQAGAPRPPVHERPGGLRHSHFHALAGAGAAQGERGDLLGDWARELGLAEALRSAPARHGLAGSELDLLLRTYEQRLRLGDAWVDQIAYGDQLLDITSPQPIFVETIVALRDLNGLLTRPDTDRQRYAALLPAVWTPGARVPVSPEHQALAREWYAELALEPGGGDCFERVQVEAPCMARRAVTEVAGAQIKALCDEVDGQLPAIAMNPAPPPWWAPGQPGWVSLERATAHLTQRPAHMLGQGGYVVNSSRFDRDLLLAMLTTMKSGQRGEFVAALARFVAGFPSKYAALAQVYKHEFCQLYATGQFSTEWMRSNVLHYVGRCGQIYAA